MNSEYCYRPAKQQEDLGPLAHLDYMRCKTNTLNKCPDHLKLVVPPLELQKGNR